MFACPEGCDFQAFHELVYLRGKYEEKPNFIYIASYEKYSVLCTAMKAHANLQYLLSYTSPHRHLLDISFTVSGVNSDELDVQLPAWRPGRYELAHYAQNIKTFQPKDSFGKKLPFKKVTKDRWKIQTQGAKTIHIEYSYYANELNAGSTFLDETQLYVNGVNCLLYVPERMDEPCELEVVLPENYLTATGLNKIHAHKFSANDYHELADCPLMASPLLQKNHFTVQRTVFTVWFQGEVKPDWKKLLNDFKKFTEAQLKMFGSFPFKEYHFLFQALPEKFHHGVEHANSTVIAVGPSHSLMNKGYDDLLGVSSHELFHAWNVKAIRPVEFLPYDYSRENYTRLGYVAEGVTTYYGDLILLRAGVFSEQQYAETFSGLLTKHFGNTGRFNLSVADSSFDTWLDGYKQGVPGRKASIYTEGALCAFMLDINIRKNTANNHSLDDVMRALYDEFGKKQKGYSEEDYKRIAEQIAMKSFDRFFENYIFGTSSYEPELVNCLDYIGFALVKKGTSYIEQSLGFKIQTSGEKTTITSVYPDSPADKSGLSVQDEIIAVNEMRVEGNLNEWCRHFSGGKKLSLTVSSNRRLKEITVEPDGRDYFLSYSIARQAKISRLQESNFKLWAGTE